MDVITHNHETFARPDDRDPAFGNNGMISLLQLPHELDTDRHVKDIKVLADDKILLSAGLARDMKGLYGLVRFNPDGRVDTTFATEGLALGNFANSHECGAGKIAVQEPGYIIMQGWLRRVNDSSPKLLVIARFNNAGSLDHSFGNDGCVVIDNSNLGKLASDSCSLQLLPHGKVLVGATYHNGDTSTGVLVRVDSQGNLDKSFNNSGQLETTHPAFTSISVNDLRAQDNGQTLVAGSVRQADDLIQGYVARYSDSGALDEGFGDSEIPGFSTLMSDEGAVTFHALVATGEDKFVGIGQFIAEKNWALLMGFDSTGSGYPEFNDGRPVLTSFSETLGSGWFGAHTQADGKILCVGGPKRLYVVRYLPSGTIDRSFGLNGLIEEDTSLTSPPVILQTQANGRILLAANTLGVAGPLGHVYAYKKY